MQALFIEFAFFFTEIVDCIHNKFMEHFWNELSDMLLSIKNCQIIKYLILKALDVLTRTDFDAYCTPQGKIGCRLDYGNSGIKAPIGPLGHGPSVPVSMACAEKVWDGGNGKTVYGAVSRSSAGGIDVGGGNDSLVPSVWQARGNHSQHPMEFWAAHDKDLAPTLGWRSTARLAGKRYR